MPHRRASEPPPPIVKDGHAIALAVLSILAQGHRFGVGNQEWMILRWRRAADPSLLPGDWMLSQPAAHPLVVDALGRVASLVGEWTALFGAHLLARVLLFMGVLRLCAALFPRERLAPVIAIVLCMLEPRLDIGRHYLQGGHFEPHFLAMALSAWALAGAARWTRGDARGAWMAGIATGLAILVHLFVGLPLLVMVVATMALSANKKGGTGILPVLVHQERASLESRGPSPAGQNESLATKKGGTGILPVLVRDQRASLESRGRQPAGQNQSVAVGTTRPDTGKMPVPPFLGNMPWHVLLALLLALAIGSPSLVPAAKGFLLPAEAPLSSRDLITILQVRHPHHHMPWLWDPAHIAAALAVVGALAIAWRRERSAPPLVPVVLLVALASCLAFALCASARVLPVVLYFQPPRLWGLVWLLASVHAAAALCRWAQKGWHGHLARVGSSSTGLPGESRTTARLPITKFSLWYNAPGHGQDARATLFGQDARVVLAVPVVALGLLHALALLGVSPAERHWHVRTAPLDPARREQAAAVRASVPEGQLVMPPLSVPAFRLWEGRPTPVDWKELPYTNAGLRDWAVRIATACGAVEPADVASPTDADTRAALAFFDAMWSRTAPDRALFAAQEALSPGEREEAARALRAVALGRR